MAAPMFRMCGQNICRFLAFNTNNVKISNVFRVNSSIFRCSPAMISTSATRYDLMEFFDDKKNWGAESVKCGRPWLKDELRLKSSSDLHKLWYVLLKERNVLLTMAHEYERQKELFPNPERLEKVEESMENILEVVDERNQAYNVLETGKSGMPELVEDVDVLGRPIIRRQKEHFIPKHMNRHVAQKLRLLGPWVYRYLRLWREKRMKERKKEQNRRIYERRRLRQEFPDAEID